MATAKQCHTLTTYYVQKFEAKYGAKPTVNRVAARWNFNTLLEDLTAKEVLQLIDYYFQTQSGRRHDLDWFFYNYDKLVKGMHDSAKDAEHRKRLMDESVH